MEAYLKQEVSVSKELAPIYESCRLKFNVDKGKKCWSIPFNRGIYEKSDASLGEFARQNEEHSILLVPRSGCGQNSYYGDMVGGPIYISPEVVEIIDPGVHGDVRLRTMYNNGLEELFKDRTRIIEITHDHPDHTGMPTVLKGLINPHLFAVNPTVYGINPIGTQDYYPDKFPFKDKKLVIGVPNDEKHPEYESLQNFVEGASPEKFFANGFEVGRKKVWFSASKHPEKGPKVTQGIGLIIQEKNRNLQYTAHDVPIITQYASDDTPLEGDGMTFRQDYLQTRGQANPDILLIAGVGGEGIKDFGKHNCTLGPIYALELLKNTPPKFLVLTQPFREEDYVSIEESLGTLVEPSRKQVEQALEKVFNRNVSDISKKPISSIYKIRVQNFAKNAGLQTQVVDDDAGVAFDLDNMKMHLPEIKQ